jgi:hypothetical protein
MFAYYHKNHKSDFFILENRFFFSLKNPKETDAIFCNILVYPLFITGVVAPVKVLVSYIY